MQNYIEHIADDSASHDNMCPSKLWQKTSQTLNVYFDMLPHAMVAANWSAIP